MAYGVCYGIDICCIIVTAWVDVVTLTERCDLN